MLLVSFDTPWKQKTFGFLMFSGGIKRDQLYEMANRLGICMCYYEIKRQKCSLLLRTIEVSRNETVPLPPSIISGTLIQTAIDNFDHEEGAPSRIGGSHHTIMIVFQNCKQRLEAEKTLRPAPLLKSDSNTGVFLWILRNFKDIFFEEHLPRAACDVYSYHVH